MRSLLLTLLNFSAALFAVSAQAAPNPAIPSNELPSKEKLHVYLLMGQSNMAGRGKVDPASEPNDRQLLVFTKEQTWAVAKDPLHWDKPKIAGVGPGLSFAKAMAEASPGTTIGLVPCAVGGTPLSRWEKGGDLYNAAVERARAAMKTGTLSGVLWHQGEADSSEKLASTYRERLVRMFQNLRADLGTPSLPIVAGELGRFHTERIGKPSQMINDALHAASKELSSVAVASSESLQDGGDKLHFGTEAQREFGRRYAAAMLKLQAAK